MLIIQGCHPWHFFYFIYVIIYVIGTCMQNFRKFDRQKNILFSSKDVGQCFCFRLYLPACTTFIYCCQTLSISISILILYLPARRFLRVPHLLPHRPLPRPPGQPHHGRRHHVPGERERRRGGGLSPHDRVQGLRWREWRSRVQRGADHGWGSGLGGELMGWEFLIWTCSGS